MTGFIFVPFFLKLIVFSSFYSYFLLFLFLFPLLLLLFLSLFLSTTGKFFDYKEYFVNLMKFIRFIGIKYAVPEIIDFIQKKPFLNKVVQSLYLQGLPVFIFTNIVYIINILYFVFYVYVRFSLLFFHNPYLICELNKNKGGCII